MQIERVYYPVKTLGYGNRIGIWTVGCRHGCFNCSNPELWDNDPDKDVSEKQIINMFTSIPGQVDGVTITGGEPFQQAEELLSLVLYLYKELTQDILIYSGYTLEELQQWKNPTVDKVLAHIAVLIDGKYIEELNDNSSLRGSSNQRIHILNKAYTDPACTEASLAWLYLSFQLPFV